MAAEGAARLDAGLEVLDEGFGGQGFAHGDPLPLSVVSPARIQFPSW
jgi:hypothetical protein